jgi:hypothetical protein
LLRLGAIYILPTWCPVPNREFKEEIRLPLSNLEYTHNLWICVVALKAEEEVALGVTCPLTLRTQMKPHEGTEN